MHKDVLTTMSETMNKLEFLNKMEKRVRMATCARVGGWIPFEFFDEEHNEKNVLLQRVKEKRNREFQKFLKERVKL